MVLTHAVSAREIWRQYTIAGGLYANEIRATVGDVNGIKWFGTDVGGVARFDSENWTMKKTFFSILFLFFLKSSYSDNAWTSWSNDISSILSIAFEDSIVWFGTVDGLFKYNKNTGIVERFTTRDGLLNDYVFSIAVDHDGNKWFGSIYGVTKFDGTTWETFLLSSYCFDIAVAPNNDVWLASWNGIMKYSGGEWNTVKSGNYSCITVDDEGVVWVGSNMSESYKNFILRIDGSSETMIGTDNGTISYQPVRDITVDRNTGLVWSAVHIGVVSYDDKEKKLSEYFSKAPDLMSFFTIAVDRNSTVWLGNNLGVASFRDGNEKNYTLDDGLIDNRVHSLACDNEGILWIGAEIGLMSFDGEVFTTRYKTPLYADIIASIVIDNDNTVWFSHMGEMRIDHLSYFKDGKWSIGPNGIYRLLAVDRHNVLWGAQYVLYSYDGKEVISHDIIVPLPGFECDTTRPGQIMDMFIDENDIIWIASSGWGDCTHSGIFTYDGEKVVPRILGYFNSVTMDSQRNVWGGGSDGLFKYDGIEWKKFSDIFKYSPRYEYFSDIAIGSDDVIWFVYGFNRGSDSNTEEEFLVCYNGSTFTEFTKNNSGIPGNNIYSISVDRNNTKWIGTDSGVVRFEGETWTTFNTQNSGLCDNKINAIAVEKNNTIWFGTDNGVSRYTEEMITLPSDVDETKPEALPILKAFPNPFNPSTTIEFTLSETKFSTLTIYNMAGQKVCVLASERMIAGTHRLQWDGKDNSGSSVSAGVYIAHLKAGEMTATGNLVLVK